MNYTAGRIRTWLLPLVILLIVGVAGLYEYVSRPQPPKTPAAVQQQTPQKVAAPETNTKARDTEYTSHHGVILKLDSRPSDSPIASPFILTGKVPGNWSFEASFPVEIINSDGVSLAKAPAHLQGDWITTEYVPFTVTLTFAQPMQLQQGQLILRKDNPSGNTETEDEAIIPIQITPLK